MRNNILNLLTIWKLSSLMIKREKIIIGSKYHQGLKESLDFLRIIKARIKPSSSIGSNSFDYIWAE